MVHGHSANPWIFREFLSFIYSSGKGLENRLPWFDFHLHIDSEIIKSEINLNANADQRMKFLFPVTKFIPSLL